MPIFSAKLLNGHRILNRPPFIIFFRYLSMESHVPSSNINFGPHPLHPDQIFFESSLSYGIVNLKPIVQGHILMIPKRTVSRVSELTISEMRDLFESVHIVGPALEWKYGCSALNIAIQDGIDAGQSVPHVHVHILPRKPGDFERNDEVHEKIDKFGSEQRKPRTMGEMSAECFELRALFNAEHQPRF